MNTFTSPLPDTRLASASTPVPMDISAEALTRMPMSLPALGVVAIFTFLNEWNDFLAPLIYLNTEDTQTLAIAIQFWRNHATLQVQWQRATFPQTMAMSTILTIPPVLVFFFLQRYFIQGIVVTGVKG